MTTQLTPQQEKIKAMSQEVQKRLAKIDALFAKIDVAVAKGDTQSAIDAINGIEGQLIKPSDLPKVVKPTTPQRMAIRSQIKPFNS